MNMRDPAIYRIVRAHHHRQGDKWCIYPCTTTPTPFRMHWRESPTRCALWSLKNHRPLYDWVVDNIGFEKSPISTEFARLNVTYTVMSKRYLRELVETKLVDGWDDPECLPSEPAQERVYPASLFDFVKRAGVAKAYSVVDLGLLEHCIREELNATASRRIAVTEPLKLTITNLPEDHLGTLTSPTTRRTRRRVPVRCPLLGSCMWRGGLCRGAAAQVLPSQARRRSPSHGRLYCQVQRGGLAMRGARWWSCAVLPTWRRATACLPTGAKSREPSTGFPPPTPSTPT